MGVGVWFVDLMGRDGLVEGFGCWWYWINDGVVWNLG